jgi:hypothetical protein
MVLTKQEVSETEVRSLASVIACKRRETKGSKRAPQVQGLTLAALQNFNAYQHQAVVLQQSSTN